MAVSNNPLLKEDHVLALFGSHVLASIMKTFNSSPSLLYFNVIRNRILIQRLICFALILNAFLKLTNRFTF